MTSAAAFIADYPNAPGSIDFAWNGQHGERFVDANYAFRKEVLAAVLAAPNVVSQDLLRALFIAETDHARESWGVDMRIAKLAELLLATGEG